ncbi:MAG: aldehyde dehydrogenase family protein [Planctomycetota bacterium]
MADYNAANSLPETNSLSEMSVWTEMSIAARCRCVAAASGKIAEAADELVALAASDQRVDPVDTLAAELIPLCGALKLIGKRGRHILRPRHHGLVRRPMWMWGVRSTVYRDPFGTVLILGTWNYPLLLVGTQIGQALAAGNRVVVKPAIGSERVTERMVRTFYDAGVPESMIHQIDSSTESAIQAIDAGVDLIVLTGAAATGRKVMAQASKSLTPTIMELSGCDAVIVLDDADLEFTAKAVAWALCVNSGATCIGPRRLLVSTKRADSFLETLKDQLKTRDPAIVHPAARASVADAVDAAIDRGAIDCLGAIDTDRMRADGTMRPTLLDHVLVDDEVANADLFAPISSIIRYDDVNEAVKIVNNCPYRLAASVFGSRAAAQRVASRLKVGSVTVNDLVMPTGDPRLPFGGRGNSGFGVTRGEEGLLAMTTPRVVSRRNGKFAVHLAPRKPYDAEALLASLQILHAGSWRQRIRGVFRMMRAPNATKAPKADASPPSVGEMPKE